MADNRADTQPPQQKAGWQRVHIKKLPEGVYLATSDNIQGLVAQGRTVSETLEIARDVARKLLEAQGGRRSETELEPIADNFDYPLLVAT